MEWYRRQDQETKPYIVGVGWLLKSKKAGERLDEAEFTVDFAVEDIFQKVWPLLDHGHHCGHNN